MWQVLGRGLVVCAALVLAASFGGDLHGVGDSLAVFRALILVGCVVVSLLVWRWRIAQGLIAVALCLGLMSLSDGLFATRPATPDLIVYQKNLLFWERDRNAFLADVGQSGADIVTLQEVGPANEAVLDALLEDYPHQLLCNAPRARNVAVVSRTAFTQAECLDLRGAARVVTNVGGRSVQVYSLHLFWPWPYSQREQVARIASVFNFHKAPFTVVSGDFNMTQWGRSITAIERATGTTRLGRAVWTYNLYGYPLAIDHVLSSAGHGTVEARGMFGSDHRGLIAAIAWDAQD